MLWVKYFYCYQKIVFNLRKIFFMKRRLLLSLLSLLSVSAFAQPDTLILKPGPQDGQDAMVFTSYSCTFDGDVQPGDVMNFGAHPDMRYGAWTYHGLGCGEGITRSLLRFNGLSSFPAGATIISARLYLYGVSSSLHYANSSFPGSGHGTTNEGWIKRVTSDWDENTVTWNTQPTTTDMHQVALPVTTSHFNFDTDVDVTTLVQDIISSDQNYGFLLKLQQEVVRRNVVFATSENANSAWWPELRIIYNNPTSISTTNGLTSLNLYPNPATNKVQVELPQNASGEIHITVSDITGKVVYQQHQGHTQPLIFSVADWSRGFYLVQVTGNNWRAVQKLAVQ